MDLITLKNNLSQKEWKAQKMKLTLSTCWWMILTHFACLFPNGESLKSGSGLSHGEMKRLWTILHILFGYKGKSSMSDAKKPRTIKKLTQKWPRRNHCWPVSGSPCAAPSQYLWIERRLLYRMESTTRLIIPQMRSRVQSLAKGTISKTPLCCPRHSTNVCTPPCTM